MHDWQRGVFVIGLEDDRGTAAYAERRNRTTGKTFERAL